MSFNSNSTSNNNNNNNNNNFFETSASIHDTTDQQLNTQQQQQQDGSEGAQHHPLNLPHDNEQHAGMTEIELKDFTNLRSSSGSVGSSAGGGGGSSGQLSKSSSMVQIKDQLDEQDTQIPLYYSMTKEKQRKKILKLRSKLKNKFKNKDGTTTTTSTAISPQSPKGFTPNNNKKKKKQGDEPVEVSNDHMIPLEELSTKFSTNLNLDDLKYSMGITSKDAEERLERDGPNALTPKKPVPKWVKFLLQFLSLFPLMLEIGGILSFVAYGVDKESGSDNLYLGIILWAVVLFTTIFTFLQESKSAHVMDGFKKLAPTSTKVVRDSHLIEINSEKLVVGDVIHIRAGDRIPADIRIIYSHHLKVDNASLTGESEPQSRTAECTDENAFETSNLAFYGTMAVDGDCVGVVIATGNQTTIGKIARLATHTKPLPTPLKTEIEQFIRIITIVSISLGLILLVVGFATKVKWILVIIYCISVVVAQVPEGLLPTITVLLTLTATRMSKKNVLVKNLLAVETFGSTSTIASDKTGTLTQNIMTVVHLWYDGAVYSCDAISPNNYMNKESKTFKELFKIAALCSRTVFDRSDPNWDSTPIQQRNTIGDASESALLKFCEQVENVEGYRRHYPKIFEIPFNSVNKWQLSVHIDESNGNIFLLIKGAPERIVKMCTTIMSDGESIPISDGHMENFQQSYELLAGKGERALGMAMINLDPKVFHKDYVFDVDEKNFPTEGFTFVGLTTLMDPPRPSVPGAIEDCKKAGVRVMMVTGDHPLTAQSIARQIGIIQGETLNDVAKNEGIDVLDVDFSKAGGIVIPGSRLDDLTDEHWNKILALKQIVFARTSPEQKLIIVSECQKRGEIVAVTGDGVNDSPALKKADLGCAMGITGSEVAKEAAAIVLLDDNFSSIVSGIEEGRMIFDKLKKSITYTLSSNVPELTPFLCFFLLKLPAALSGILILCIDLGTDLVPVISYSYEYPETDLMNRKPRNIKTDKLVSFKLAIFSYVWLGFVQCAAGFFNFFMMFRTHGISASDLFYTSSDYFMDGAADFMGYTAGQQMSMLKEAQSAYFIAVIITRMGAALSCKTRTLSLFQHGFKNMVFNCGLISMLGVGLIIVHVPGIQDFFGATAVSYKFWLYPIPFAVFLVIVNEIRLYIVRRDPTGLVARYTYW
ncbi:P-type ATPase [Cavenderia fasciculata]|uniref:P-type ATPase n=1 Tax=Cavenderia fasciculata TaxID=261658 RepID=F4Q8L3_CACFS|nr:P-type ATPase [Cavenderia fasciculata]EGG16113.1 P-type ATPase [Cavenderia fasciculata]|eukprot:XP_004352438.1 P-type ATPase [Cavenderia fasciculata]